MTGHWINDVANSVKLTMCFALYIIGNIVRFFFLQICIKLDKKIIKLTVSVKCITINVVHFYVIFAQSYSLCRGTKGPQTAPEPQVADPSHKLLLFFLHLVISFANLQSLAE